MNKNVLTITKDNRLIEASYTLTLDEQRLILACIAQIDSREIMPRTDEFKLTASEFAGLYGLGIEHAYEQMKAAMTRLYERNIVIERDIKQDNGHEIRWLSEKRYRRGDGYVILVFSQGILPYLTQLRERFTSYRLQDVAAFKSTHSIRLYELLMQFQGQGQRLIPVDQFKTRLGIGDGYPRFVDLKRWVIEPAVSEINEKSSLIVTWEALREKRVVYLLKFSFASRIKIAE